MKKMTRENGDAQKTVNRHSSLVCCACSCIFEQIMIIYYQLTKLEYEREVLVWHKEQFIIYLAK